MKRLTRLEWIGLALAAVLGTAAASYFYGWLTGIFLLGCCTAYYAIFCRLVVVNRRTWLPIRLAFIVVSAALAFGIWSVLFWWHRASYVETGLVIALATLLAAASRRWRNGSPAEFDSSDRTPLERAGSI